MRLARAVAMLRAGASCANVAHILGFADQAHLSTAFKQHYRFCPTRYIRWGADGNDAETRHGCSADE